MRTTPRVKPTAAQPRSNPAQRRPQFRPAGLQPNARAPQNAQAKYEYYLARARAEALAGDVIAAENYYQHAEHYLRSMREHAN
jgi:Domain of unknown function (DUF4167)